jgi:very-short-patch-repair endonuclease
MPNHTPTKQENDLAKALKKRGIELEQQHNDNHKHVDIYISKCNLYIEVDGLPHQTKTQQIISDLWRDHFSTIDGISTMRVSNEVVEHHLEELVDAITDYCQGTNVGGGVKTKT